MHADLWNLRRRQWLQWTGGAAALLAARGSLDQPLPANPWPVTEQLFGLGVASGDPAPDGMVLWTRLMPGPRRPLLGPQPVRWELADDAQFRRIVQSGETVAEPGWGHSVHVEVHGLPPGRWYHYRFLADGETSAVGRTCTAPAPGSRPERLRLVFASCQRWEHGYYTAWQHALREDPELVLFLGDYIYEYATPPKPDGLARTQPLPYPHTLQDYRDRYALHKSDAHLQAMHAHCPWIVTWDDHEVENDYAGEAGVGHGEAFLRKRLAAWQAFYENMPLRASTLARGLAAPQVYRRQPWGQLADLLVLDARQYRDIQACRSAGEKSNGSVLPADCADLARDTRSFLGLEQERWLHECFHNNSTSRNPDLRWNVICQQTLFAPRRFANGKQSTDSWDGYPAARSRLLQALQQAAPRNTVLLGGDIHQNYVCRVHAPDASGQIGNDTPVLASEFCGTSITSRSGTTQARVDAIVRHNPQVLFARCEERGYGLCDITPQQWTTHLRALDDPLNPHSGIHTQASFAVADRQAGPVRL
ncbi:MAG: alkaline phosphatase D family protein [Comamonas sp.]